MTIVVISALLVSFIAYLFIGFYLSRSTKDVGDMLPLITGKLAQVKNKNEFSISTVAATISLATVILTFYELAPYYGYWLYWCVLTTAVGIYVVRIFAKHIWKKINEYDHRPSLHEFIATEFTSPRLEMVAAACTSLGFLGAFAVELTVGTRFLSSLIPQISPVITISALSLVAFIYTSQGGYRAVIVSDIWQMFSIWGLLLVLAAFYIYYALHHGGFAASYSRIPTQVTHLSMRDGLIPFLIGICIINVPTYLSDMGIWQRIGAAQKQETVFKGLRLSVLNSIFTWGLIVTLSCFVFIIIKPKGDENALFTLMNALGTQGTIGKIVIFVSVLGLFGAMLSTSSTQLIATSHAIYEDILAGIRGKSLTIRLAQKSELGLSRLILIISALVATVFVGFLNYMGFSIADLIFSIYGSQLGLVTPVIFALLFSKEKLLQLNTWAGVAIVVGFVSGWFSAIYGKAIGSDNLIFLAPCISLVLSFSILMTGYLTTKKDA